MSIVLLSEADYPKDEERDKKRVKFSRDVLFPYYEKMVKEKGIKVKFSLWVDNTGHLVSWSEFETMEDFAKMWNDERWQHIMARRARLVDNVSFRLLRPGFYIPEDLK
jgi:hypothetical protein